MNKDLVTGYIIFFCMLAIGIASVFVKWTTILLFVIVIGIIAIIISNLKNSEKKDVIYKITEEPFKNVRLKIDNNGINRDKIIKQIGLFDKSIYDSMFETKIMDRGEKYYIENRIKDLIEVGNKYSCKINGTEEYDVSITFNKENLNEIIEISCSCPYFLENDKNCKHIYALLYRVKCGRNRKKIEEAVNEHIAAVAVMGEGFNKFVRERKNTNLRSGFDSTKRLDEVTDEYKRIAEVFKKENTKEEKLENELLEVVMALVKNTIKYKAIIELIINLTYSNSSNNGSNHDIQKQKDSLDIGAKDVLSGLIVADEIEKKINKKNKLKKEAQLDKEYKYTWNLDDNEIDHIKEEGYDTWNFEEEDLEEDDYYSEDE